jgi:hypothetical protein
MSNIIFFLVEGKDLDKKLINSIKVNYFEESKNVRVIPFETNIYSLYVELKKDDFDTDIISLLKEKFPDDKILNEIKDRDSVSEVFLFFDHDAHHREGMSDCEKRSFEEINEMLSVFNNETINGKLYISYPMIESTFHYTDHNIQKQHLRVKYVNPYRATHDNNKHYKDIVKIEHDGRLNAMMYGETFWKDILISYFWLVSYIMESDNFLEYNSYQEFSDPLNIFKWQYEKNMQVIERIVVMSAYPGFLIEYFGEKIYKDISLTSKFYKSSEVIDFG